MANRLTIITTRTGDDGTSSLADGKRIAKSSPAFAALGDIDELNSVLGVAIAHIDSAVPVTVPSEVRTALAQIQNDLFDLGAELAWPGHNSVSDDHLAFVDECIAMNASLPPLKEFVLPGGSIASGHLQHARAVCRRAERAVIAMQADVSVDPLVQRYLNRLSDTLFIFARIANQSAGRAEPTWQKRKK
jgi:cob(I)alamin adenosyltransferase